MKKSLLAMTAVAALGTAAHAEVFLNIDFGSANGVPTGAGVVGDAGDFWNSFNNIQGFRANSLSDAGGNALQIGQFGAGPEGGTGSGFGYASDPLFEDYGFLNDNGTDNDATLNSGGDVAAKQRFTIFGDDLITPPGENYTYDIIFIGSGDNPGQGASFSLIQPGGQFITASYTGVVYDGTLTEGDNFARINGVVPTGGTGNEFDIDIYIPSGSTGSATLAGIQIIRNVPEPGSMALLGLGGLAVFRRRK